MQLSKASKFALYALVEMALRPGVRVSASSVATRLGLSENHFAKVMQQLARGGFVKSVRGAGGGYELIKAPDDITMADVVRCIEGEIAEGPCADCPFRMDAEQCGDDPAACSVHRLLNELNQHVYYTLESVTIQTLARSPNRSPLGL